ncbi:MAG: hypothetical protein JXA20_07090 [Spirochaetes bacterium]|nr:hypothetical protein [Spirochaetota bacterium]
MTEEQYLTFVRDHRDQIVAKVKELDNFDDTSISFLKTQIIRGINIRMRMPVVPMNEITQLLVGLVAIRFIEYELGFEY